MAEPMVEDPTKNYDLRDRFCHATSSSQASLLYDKSMNFTPLDLVRDVEVKHRMKFGILKNANGTDVIVVGAVHLQDYRKGGSQSVNEGSVVSIVNALKSNVNTQNLPWIFSGDFNCVMHDVDGCSIIPLPRPGRSNSAVLDYVMYRNVTVKAAPSLAYGHDLSYRGKSLFDHMPHYVTFEMATSKSF